MGMFSKSRKVKEEDPPLGISNADYPPAAKASRALTRKKKKQEVEQKPVFDLTSALPDTNDFRTSLLMPGLSTRFSMLREQDDPNTLLGKASDDSVLFPKRASRLMLFNHNQLSDIAEVESIRSDFRPPFAEMRNSSMSDGYASDDGGSIMNRSRPGEGNNLFGGRQKLYKITTGSTKDLARSKHMYENDVSLSAFQQMRLREKEQREQLGDVDDHPDRSSYPYTESDGQDLTRSPLTGFSQNRGTQSSTNSGPSNRRTSTAATSVVSESPLPHQTTHAAVNKIREQDANSSAESIGFSASPGFRTVVREDGKPTFRLSGSRSAVNMRDAYSKQSPVPPQSFRGMSPPLSATTQPLDFGLRDNSHSQRAPSRTQTGSPIVPFDFEQDDALAANVRPNDRGKATALGLFNKPARHYDDAQFQQRQVQMHEGRNSPNSVNSRAASRASPDPNRSGRPSFASVSNVLPHDDGAAPQIPPIPDYPPSPTSNRRVSAGSSGRTSTSRPRTKSSASTREAAVKARVESLIRRQNAELAALEESHLGPNKGQDEEKENGHAGGTFFDNSDGSDDEDQRQSSHGGHPPSMPAPPPPADVHPALRNGIQDFDFGTQERKSTFSRDSHYSTASGSHPVSEERKSSQHERITSSEAPPSLALPNTGLGLSGMIRHLRHDSDKSSIYPPPSPAFPSAEYTRGSVSSVTRTGTESVKSDPFEYDNDRLGARQAEPQPQAPPTPTTMMSQKAQQILGTAMALRDANTQASKPLQIDPYNNAPREKSNQVQSPTSATSHQRSESTETQREMQRFDEELAARRKRIEEGLQRVQERSQERSQSRSPPPNGGHSFTLPRFPGRSNTADRFENQGNKAMKMLGISPGSRDMQPSPRMPPEPNSSDYERSQSRSQSRGTNSRQGQRPSPPHDQDRPYGRQTPNQGRSGPSPGPGNGYGRPPPPRSTTPSSKAGGRSRSSSAAADRSVSRNKYIPDFDRSMMPGAFPASPYMNNKPSPQTEFGKRSESPATRAYDRSGSSAAGNHVDRNGYFNAKPLATPDIGGEMTPRPSPRPSQSPASEPGLQQMATPMSPPSSAMPSPNPAAAGGANGRTTPSATGRSTPSGTRKKSISKYMISEPTFVSSTSTIPLVHLPRDGGPNVEPIVPPPVPAMNPRRRGTGDEQSPIQPSYNPYAADPSATFDYNSSNQSLSQSSQPRPRNKLRKSSSEGGHMAARARQQALAAEMIVEKERSPNVAVFPNRSTTSIQTHEGGMF